MLAPVHFAEEMAEERGDACDMKDVGPEGGTQQGPVKAQRARAAPGSVETEDDRHRATPRVRGLSDPHAIETEQTGGR